ncbi:hypothetical protein MTO96_000020 [Rhipicephalus appendiculatus]
MYEGSPLGAALSEQRNHACVDAERQFPVIVPAINPDATAATSLLFGHLRRLQPPSDFSGQDRSHCASMAKTRLLFAPQALLSLVTCFVIHSHPASQHVRGSPLGAALSEQRNHACVDAERQYRYRACYVTRTLQQRHHSCSAICGACSLRATSVDKIGAIAPAWLKRDCSSHHKRCCPW